MVLIILSWTEFIIGKFIRIPLGPEKLMAEIPRWKESRLKVSGISAEFQTELFHWRYFWPVL